MMKKIKSKFGVLVLLIVFLNGCLVEKTSVKQIIFEKKYSCDSINSPTYDFVFEDDSAVYSLMKKVPFDFKFRISIDYIEINKSKYHYILGGLNIDTLGMVNITKDTYLYRKDKNANNSSVLFSFNKKLKESWLIEAEGYFNDYKVVLEDKKYNKAIKDTIYSFSYTFLGQKFPNGYYLKSFDVSKKYGILNFKFSNGVGCHCVIE